MNWPTRQLRLKSRRNPRGIWPHLIRRMSNLDTMVIVLNFPMIACRLRRWTKMVVVIMIRRHESRAVAAVMKTIVEEPFRWFKLI
uniref:Uncharacterized protein n=1 Tax=Globodera pallida TaxID=36090 RepID=A0A183CAU9_GLOPA